MASTIKVDNVQNQPGTNIINKCSVTTTIGAGAGETGNVCAATVNLGRCGGTVALACGASQTGFGRTGTVDWETSIQTGTVTAATGKGYFVNTTSGGITVNLPAGAAGSIVAVSDYASTADSNNITIAANGAEKINGDTGDYVISTKGLAVTLVYADAGRGWKSVTGSDADATGVSALYVVATGGSPCSGAVCGDYKTHTFTGPGTFCVSAAGNACGSNTVDYVVIAGGGGGTNQPPSSGNGGGGGGFRISNGTATGCYTVSPLATTPTTVPAIPVTVQGYPVVVGGGGAVDAKGDTSSFSSVSSTGGGSGYIPVGDGGSGGGQGNGNTPPTTPPQGQNGGPGNFSGGGGAGGTGGAFSGPNTGGPAGIGSYVDMNPAVGEPGPAGRYFSGGGGGGYPVGSPSGTPGGTGGGGTGAEGAVSATSGTVNTGGGGGGGGPGGTGGGGSGIVIIRYKFQ